MATLVSAATREPRPRTAGRGCLLAPLLGQLRAVGCLDAVLAAAGVARSARTLSDPATHLSYVELRRILWAAARHLGGPEALRAFTRDAPGWGRAASVALGGRGPVPASLAACFDPVVPGRGDDGPSRIRGAWTGPGQVTIRLAMLEGVEPFPEYCAYRSGRWAGLPVSLGLPAAGILEEECQCDGAPACRLRLRIPSFPGR